MVEGITPNIYRNGTGVPVLPPFPEKWKEPYVSCLKITKLAKSVFNFLEDRVWPYMKQGAACIKNSLKLAVIKCPKFKLRYGQAIAGIGLLSAVSFFLILKSIPGSVENFLKNLSLRDHEGVAQTMIGIIMSPVDAMDQLGTFINSLSTLEAIPTIGFFSMIALPLVFAMLSYGAAKATYDIVRSGIHLHQMQKEVTNENLDGLKKYIKEQIGMTREEYKKIREKYPFHQDQIREITILKDRKVNILARHTDKKVVNIMKNLQKHLEENPNDAKTADKAVKDMRKLTKRKIVLDAIGLGFTVTMLTSLVVSTLTGLVPAVVAPMILIGKAVWGVSKHVYKNGFALSCPCVNKKIVNIRPFFDRGLNLPHFAAAA